MKVRYFMVSYISIKNGSVNAYGDNYCKTIDGTFVNRKQVVENIKKNHVCDSVHVNFLYEFKNEAEFTDWDKQ